MTITTEPTRSRTTAGRISVDPMHLSINTRMPNGHDRNLHLLADEDLRVNVQDGKKPDGAPIRYNADLVLKVLECDDDHDEVHIEQRAGMDMRAGLLDAMECLQRSLDALDAMGYVRPE